MEKPKMILAGDIGGTKALLGLFDPGEPRPRPVATRSFVTLSYDDLSKIVSEFLDGLSIASDRIAAASFGVAGPVIGGTATLTNVRWIVDARTLGERVHIARVNLLNDLEAMAHGLTVLDRSEVHVLQEGHAVADGNIGLIAAGTGLGVAMLHRVNGRHVPFASEGGHADFAARNDREIRLMKWLTDRYGRAEVEGVISGLGLLNVHRAAHADRPCAAVSDLAHPEAAAEITAAALAKRCPGCVETLEMFVDAYGSEAGNLALRSVSTGGLFIGGGIAAKILPAMVDGRFMRAFLSKGSFETLLSSIPVKIVMNPETALLGAAVQATQM